MEEKTLREPIVCVLGHVDHGKTTLLDAIRGTTIASSEAGGITQRIGATEIPLSRLEKATKSFPQLSKIRVPGLLFVDTPGHVAFSNMRARGGALADIAILVIDINDGIMPQTVESINTLKKFKTPFVIVANKIDLISYCVGKKNTTFRNFIKDQRPEYTEEFDKRFYKLVGQLYDLGFSAERFDRVTDFAKTVAIVPTAARSHVGVMDTIFVLAGLAQRFLENEIELQKDAKGRATVIEVKREESVGTLLDSVLYQGKICKGNRIAVNTRTGPQVSKIKALFVNKNLRSRDLTETASVSAAAAARIMVTDKIEILPGSPIIVIDHDSEIEPAFEEIRRESTPDIELEQNGIMVKADTLGSLEAICYEIAQKDIKIRSAAIGDISKKDLINASTVGDRMDRVIVGFNVSLTPDAREESDMLDAHVLVGNIIYSIVEDLEKGLELRKKEMDEATKGSMPIPSKLSVMPEYIFRATKPVIVGVRIHSGRIKVGDSFIKQDGRFGGTVKSIRDGNVSRQFADAPAEVAVAIDGVTLNRHISTSETLYVDIPEGVVREIRRGSLDEGIMETLEEIIKIKRRENIFWGTRA